MHRIADLVEKVDTEMACEGTDAAIEFALEGLSEVQASMTAERPSFEYSHPLERFRSHATNSHYKQFINEGEGTGVMAWVHYHPLRPGWTDNPCDGPSPIPGVEGRFADSTHHHRYGGLVVGMLQGQYDQVLESVTPLDDEIATGAQVEVKELSRETIRKSGRWCMRPHEWHRLDNVADNTITIVLQIPPFGDTSFSVDPDTMRLREHPVPKPLTREEFLAAIL